MSDKFYSKFSSNGRSASKSNTSQSKGSKHSTIERSVLMSRAYCRTVFIEQTVLEAEWTIENHAAWMAGVKLESSKFRTDFGVFCMQVKEICASGLKCVIFRESSKKQQTASAVKFEVKLTFFEKAQDGSKNVVTCDLLKTSEREFSAQSPLQMTTDPITLTLKVIKVGSVTNFTDLTSSFSH